MKNPLLLTGPPAMLLPRQPPLQCSALKSQFPHTVTVTDFTVTIQLNDSTFLTPFTEMHFSTWGEGTA